MKTWIGILGAAFLLVGLTSTPEASAESSSFVGVGVSLGGINVGVQSASFSSPYGGHGYGGYGYGAGYAYGYRPMFATCGLSPYPGYMACYPAYRRRYSSFSLGIRVGSFGLGIRSVSF